MIAEIKLTTIGTTQTVTLPEEFHINDDEVYLSKIDDVIMLVPRNKKTATLLNSLNNFTDDFMNTREQPPLQTREPLE
ncbi:MAG: AbrB/MazE/SpoVT family DNA-binding domain-containing protein [Ignavibacteriae bacterium]|nr:AbrB/MazE/SpoVT family DNA-binding domain-containing protein [Ignavibacteriota bacterium]